MTAGFEPAMTVLQTGALPLGYRTIHYSTFNDSNGNRTRVTAVKGRCLNRLTMEPHRHLRRTPRVGLEPTTTRLTAECSTIELSRNKKQQTHIYNETLFLLHTCVLLPLYEGLYLQNRTLIFLILHPSFPLLSWLSS